MSQCHPFIRMAYEGSKVPLDVPVAICLQFFSVSLRGSSSPFPLWALCSHGSISLFGLSNPKRILSISVNSKNFNVFCHYNIDRTTSKKKQKKVQTLIFNMWLYQPNLLFFLFPIITESSFS